MMHKPMVGNKASVQPVVLYRCIACTYSIEFKGNIVNNQKCLSPSAIEKLCGTLLLAAGRAQNK